ncbi:hypothetical protein BDZ97DRAFT_1755240 [Flammula alnicola]|nr:hypothetical protein BDZ97DRAFT_1755240 [Flammula alnicola]
MMVIPEDGKDERRVMSAKAFDAQIAPVQHVAPDLALVSLASMSSLRGFERNLKFIVWIHLAIRSIRHPSPNVVSTDVDFRIPCVAFDKRLRSWDRRTSADMRSKINLDRIIPFAMDDDDCMSFFPLTCFEDRSPLTTHLKLFIICQYGYRTSNGHGKPVVSCKVINLFLSRVPPDFQARIYHKYGIP